MSRTALPVFPFARAAGDPFTPPPPAGDAPVSRVLLPTGQEAWVVTRHEDVRQMLRDPAFSARDAAYLSPAGAITVTGAGAAP